MMTQHNWGWTKTSGAGNRSQDIPAPRKFDRFRESLGESDGRKVPCGRSDEESGRRSKDQGGMTWLYEEELTSFMTSMFLLLICSVFIYQNFLRLGYPKIWWVTVYYSPSKMDALAVLPDFWDFNTPHSFTSWPGVLFSHSEPQRKALQWRSKNSTRA